MKRKIANSYHRIEVFCLHSDSKFDLTGLLEEVNTLSTGSEKIAHEIEKFYLGIEKQPLSSLMLLWAQLQGKNRLIGERHLSLLCDLLQEGLFPPKRNMTINQFAKSDFASIISRIRLHEKWFLQKREDFVSFFVEFINGLSQIVYGLIPPIMDMDRHITLRRKVPFEKYIELLSLLPLGEVILTKLFYLGGERALEDVLALEIKHLDFHNNKIEFPDYSVSYPQHVLEDIKKCIGARKKGFIFIGKQGEKINHTVPYRALKAAAQKIGLPSTFAFKDLVKDR